MSGRTNMREIKPMEPELAMGLVGRPTHRINFVCVLERHHHNESCARAIMGVRSPEN
jgi:hypothetical protein